MEPPRETNRGIVLVVMTLVSFVTPFMTSSVIMALPVIGRELKMDVVMLGWVATAYILASAVLLIPVGRLADIYGRRRVFTYGILAFTVFSVLCGVASSGTLLIAFRVLQAAAGAMIWGNAVAIISSAFPMEERGRAIGINVGAVYLGLSLGPFLGGVITENLGWRSIFFIGAMFSLVLTVLILWKMRGEWADARGERFDLLGALTYVPSLGLFMYGLSSMPTVRGAAFMAAGVILFWLFTRRESRTASPLLDLSLFLRNRPFALSSVAVMIHNGATYGVIFLLSLYLQYNKGYSPQIAGLILVSRPIVQAIFAPIGGRLSDRADPRLMAAIGMAVTCASLVYLAFIQAETGLGYIIVGLAILGLGIALFSAPNTNAAMGSVERKHYGVASATINTMRTSGSMLSMAVNMILLSVFIGNVQITPEYYAAFTTSARTSLAVFAVLSFLGIFAAFAGMRLRRNSQADGKPPAP